MKETILSNWHIARILRLVLGIVIIIQGAIEHETVFVLMGVVFTGMAVFSVGCCGPAGCQTSSSLRTQEKTSGDEVSYEEIE